MAFNIDKKFVADLLGEPVKELTVVPGTQMGDNMAGTLLALTVETDSGRKLQMMYKGMVDASASFIRDFLIEVGCFRVENAFYETIAPAMKQLAESRGAPELGKLPVPHFYGGFNNDDGDYLVMQDMRPEGYTMPDKYVGLNLEETRMLMREMGRFHALGYVLLRWEGEKFLKQKPDFKFLIRKIGEREENFALGLCQILKDSVACIEKKDSTLGKKAQGAICGGLAEDLFKTAMITDRKFFPTFVHGDLWVNNILYKRDESGRPVDLRIIDFQQTHRGNVFEDLQYFIFTSTTPAFRKRHLTEVLEAYYDSFVDAVDRLDFSVPANFTRGFLIDNFFDCYLTAYRYMCFAIPLQIGDPMEFTPGPPQMPEGTGAPTGDPFAGMTKSQIDTQMMVLSCKTRLENGERALARLMDITRELVELKVL